MNELPPTGYEKAGEMVGEYGRIAWNKKRSGDVRGDLTLPARLPATEE